MSIYSLHPSDPGVDDDRSNGFFKGHRWINTRQDRELVLIDHAIGAAVWEATAEHHVLNKMEFTGVANWRESGKYWGVGGGTFYLKRSGEGFINSERVIWTKVQTIALTVNACNFIRIDADGIISKTTTWAAADFLNYINLFEVWYVSDSEYIVCKEDHLVRFNADVSVHLHEMLGTLFIEPTGAQMARVSAGTGGAAGDREIKIVNADILEDHGLETEIPDSSGAGVTFEWLYTEGDGDWRRDAQQTEAVMKWNDGGTPTGLGANKYGVWRFAATKDNKNSSDPVYLAAMGDAEYNNLTAARNAIAAGVPNFTNEIELLEVARLGYCIVQNSGGGYIVEIIIEKDILAGNTTGAGATNVAALVSTAVADFDGVLSATDANVQSALETIDNHAAAHEDGGGDALTGANIEAIVRGALAAATDDLDVNAQDIVNVGNVEINTTGKVQFRDVALYIASDTDGILALHADEYVRTGAGTAGHALAADGDFLVSGELEVDGNAFFDANVRIHSSSNAVLNFYESATLRLTMQAQYATDQFVNAISDGVGRQYILTEYASRGQDHDHAVQTNPTLYIHSATSPNTDNTQWISFTHDQTDGVIDVGTGGIKFLDDVFLGANGIGNDNPIITFGAGAFGTVTFAGEIAMGGNQIAGASNIRCADGGQIGGQNSYFTYDDTTPLILASQNIDFQGNSVKGADFLEVNEITTPGATADHGKLYTKTDDKLYFQDGAGAEHEMAYA